MLRENPARGKTDQVEQEVKDETKK